MYNLPHFKAANDSDVIAFMKAHPFIILSGVNKDNEPVATHIPVLFEERDGKLFLMAHIMRRQEHTIAFENNVNALAIFHAPHTYVSASLYQQQNLASTWNYQAVHAKGVIRFLDEIALYNLLIKLTDRFEEQADSPASVNKMDKDYVANNMKAIVAFEMEITDIEHVFKLSQNRDEKSYNNIIDHLDNSDADAQYIAQQMKKNKESVFRSSL